MTRPLRGSTVRELRRRHPKADLRYGGSGAREPRVRISFEDRSQPAPTRLACSRGSTPSPWPGIASRSLAATARPVRLGLRTADVACQRRAKRRFLARLDIQACITECDRPDVREASVSPNTSGEAAAGQYARLGTDCLVMRAESLNRMTLIAAAHSPTAPAS